MVDPAQFYGVVRRLTTDKDVDRPQVAVRVWSALFMFLPPDGNEVRASRAEIAEIAECRPDDVTRVMRKLEQLRAISRRKEGRHTVYEVIPGSALTSLLAFVTAPRPRRRARSSLRPRRANCSSFLDPQVPHQPVERLRVGVVLLPAGEVADAVGRSFL